MQIVKPFHHKTFSLLSTYHVYTFVDECIMCFGNRHQIVPSCFNRCDKMIPYYFVLFRLNIKADMFGTDSFKNTNQYTRIFYIFSISKNGIR